MKTQLLQKHFKEQAKKHKARFYPISRKLPDADAEKRIIRSFPVDDLSTYTLAMHELGHIAEGHLRWEDTASKTILKQELEAWDWANEAATVKLDSNTEKLSLRSYAYKYLPHGNHSVWKRAGVKSKTTLAMKGRIIVLDATEATLVMREFNEDYFYKVWLPRHKAKTVI